MCKWFALLLLVLAVDISAESETLSICSFNIKWLGYSTTRDNVTLARVLSNFDVIAIQEIVAPPYSGTFPSGDSYRTDPEVSAFFDEMIAAHGYEFLLSIEDTGTKVSNDDNSSWTEWFAVFYNPSILEPASHLPESYIEDDVTANIVFDRVPHAFSLRHLATGFDFVLVSVHLHAGHSSADAQAREHELDAISAWVADQQNGETHYVILGDMNFDDCDEIRQSVPVAFRYLNPTADDACLGTNTSLSKQYPYDNVLLSSSIPQNSCSGLAVIDLVDGLFAIWNPLDEPINQAYKEYGFVDMFSDHNPIAFHIEIPADDSD